MFQLSCSTSAHHLEVVENLTFFEITVGMWEILLSSAPHSPPHPTLWKPLHCFKKQKTLLQPSHYKYSNDSQVCVKFLFSPYTDNIGSLSLFSLLVPFSCRVVSSSWSASTPTRRRSWRRRSDFWTRTRAPSVKDEPPRSSCRPRVSLPMARRTRTARSKRLGFVSYLTNRYSHLVVEVEPRKWSRSRNETLGELNLSNAQRQKGNADLE